MGAKDIITNAANNTGAVATQGQSKSVFGFMKDYKDQIAAALPSHMTADRMVRVATTCFRTTPKLLECTPESLFGAIIQCSQLGLEPGNGLGHAYLLPFDKNEKRGGQWVKVRTDVQLIIGYRGMIDLARRSGQIESLESHAVYEGDVFECELGLESKLIHKPQWDNPLRESPERLTFVYAVAKLKDGGVQFQVMSRNGIEIIRKRSKAKDSGPWVTDFEQMALKTVVRRLFKMLPVSIEIQNAVSIDEARERGASFNFDPNAINGESCVVEVPPSIEIDEPESNAPITAENVLLMIESATAEDIPVIQDLANAFDKKFQMQVDVELGKKFPDSGRSF